MDAWGTPGAEENTTAPEGSNLDTRADVHIEQLQAWFTQETEKELQEVTLAEDRGHLQSPLLWQLCQCKIATARTTRPWKDRLSTLGQKQEESCTSAASYWTKRVRWQHSIHTNAARDGRGTGGH